MTNILLNTIFS